MIYLSTGLLEKKSTSSIVNYLENLNITNLELSSGPYEKSLNNFLIKKRTKNKFNFLIHNYFPVPRKAFVLNLASNKKKIRDQSIKLAKNAIKLSGVLGSKYYSFHAGFLIDPKITSLGKKIKEKLEITPREIARKNFIKSVNYLSNYAKKYNVNLLIENNVLTKKNYTRFKGNPFLFVDEKEINYLMPILPKNIGLLLDMGHLNVSSKTLKFSKIDFITKCNKWIKGYQLSNNNGLEDENKPIKSDSWFLKYIKKNKFYSLEIKLKNLETTNNQIKILKNHV